MMESDKKHQLLGLGYFVFFIIWKTVAPQSLNYTGSSLILLVGIIGSLLLMKRITKKCGDYKTFAKWIIMALISYFLGDLTWDLHEILYRTEVPAIHISTAFYFLESAFFCIAIWVLVIEKSSRWNRIQSGLDGLISSVFIFYILWKVMFKDISSDGVLSVNEAVVMAYIVFDCIVILALSVLCQSAKLSFPDKILILAAALWSLTDILYYWSVLMGSYDSGSYLDIFWVSSYLLVWYSLSNRVSMEQTQIERIDDESESENIGVGSSLILSLLYLTALVLDLKNIILIIMFSGLIISRGILSKYIYTYIINEHLTKEYKELNEILEEKVIERTQELREKNEELYKLANIDEMTELPNRRRFLQYLEYRISKNKEGSIFALLFIDLDRFKSINDWYGHELGDKLLICAAQRLKINLPRGSFLARLGGDEFVVILNNVSNERAVLREAFNLVEAFRKSFNIGEAKMNSTISVGISMYPVHGNNITDLLKNADMALYCSKDEGKNTATLHNFQMKHKEKLKLETESRLYDSIKNNELKIYCRPRMGNSGEKIACIDLELYWDNPQLGLMPFSDFRMIAEDSGFIKNIGSWLIEQACKKIKFIKEKYKVDIKLAIEISTKQFLGIDMIYELEKNLKKYRTPGSSLEIGILESFSAKDEKHVSIKFDELKKLGVGISIIDFGMGYSSVNYLKDYPIDGIKVAPEIIADMDTNVDNYKMLETIVCFGKIFNVKTIAAGVTNKKQLDILKEFGCDEFQGDYYGKPLKFGEIETLLTNL